MTKKMRLIAPVATVPSIDGSDLVTKGGSPEDRESVTDWLIDQLQSIHDQARDLINQHLATLRPPETGAGYSAKRRRRAP